MTEKFMAAWTIAIAALIALAISISATSSNYEPGTIRSSGYATEKVQPDTFSISVTVEHESNDSKETQLWIAIYTDDVTEALENLGLTVTTEYYNFYPVYTEVYPLALDGELRMCIQIYPVPPECQPKQVVSGYKAIHGLKAVGDPEKVGAGNAINTAIEAGADNVGGVYFTVSEEKQDAIKTILITQAVSDAKSKAQAAAPGDDLYIQSVDIQDSGYFPPFYRNAEKGVEILPGTVDITATVSVTFEVR